MFSWTTSLPRISRREAAPVPVAAAAYGKADELDFEIVGAEAQYIEIELDPGESAIAEAGMMMMKDPQIDMTSVFGDGSGREQGFFAKLKSAGGRLLTGESLFMTQFTHQGHGKARVAFAAPYPGRILPMRLSDHGGRLICQKDAFLAAARGVSLGIHFQQKIMTGLFGGAGFILQKLEGDGWAFLHAGGAITELELQPGQVWHVDAGCVVAFTDGVDFDIVQAGSIKSMIFGGEGVFFAQLTGPGKVWVQSLPVSRLAGRLMAMAGGAAAGGMLGSSMFGSSSSSSSEGEASDSGDSGGGDD